METIEKMQNKTANRLTEKQIKRKVGEAWALLENPVYNEKQVFQSAELLYYNADKVKVLEESKKFEKGHFALFYFGTPDPNVIYLL